MTGESIGEVISLDIARDVTRGPTLARPLLVGELDPYARPPHIALAPFPAGSPGARLASLTGLSAEEYVARYDRANLCQRVWDFAKAREEAGCLAVDRYVVVALGERVARAFSVSWEAFHVFRRPDGLYVATLPHPLSLPWTEPEAKSRGEAILFWARGWS